MNDRLDQAVRLYKEGLDRSDPKPLLEHLDGLSATEASVLLPRLVEFLRSERARLVKLRTLGYREASESRIGMTDALIARTESGR